ncbi:MULTISPECIES: OmpA family protein [Cysteiniphilum]|uniref:Peptidoglycan-associated lipoprotein n=1 Tax=Cysteiniphilum litorale TaxID=2056700 RepID=A0A8J2Z4F3_9GAMM|nr:MULTISPECIES: OmpA family protein [Cysteiniphilum]GGF95760.1 peptidoglycan-associated lipoprotein [Cysteiniphilum litorale]
MKLKIKKSTSLAAAGILSVLLIAGCASQRQAPIEGIGPEGSAGMSAHGSSVETNALGQAGSLDSQSIADLQSQIANIGQYTPAQQQAMIAALNSMSSCKTVYFAFDSTTLTNDAKTCLNQVASYLLKYNQPLRLAGHTDPRGSEKYNLNLGQRRADSVRQYLLQQGVNSNQLCTVSYGKSQPVAAPSQFYGEMTKAKAQQHAYYLDRRAELDFGQACG